MPEILPVVLSLLTAVGFGGALGAYLQARFQQRGKVLSEEHSLKQRRYLTILILMLTRIRPDKGLQKAKEYRSDINDLSDVDDELRAELLNGFIFASEEVLLCLAEFIRNPEGGGFIRTASAMRKDLWGKRARPKSDLLRSVEATFPSDG